jgi:hypothetical protein
MSGVEIMTDLERIAPRWLPLKEAALYSAIGKHRLIAMAQSGTIKGFQDPDDKRGSWIFDRDSLDAYREGQATQPTYREKALAIAGRICL